MAKKNKNRKKNSFKIPLATTIGLAAGFAGPYNDAPIDYLMRQDFRSFLVRLGKSYTGYDANTGKWLPHLMNQGLVPLVIGGLVSKYVGGWPLNVNKRLNLPFIKI